MFIATHSISATSRTAFNTGMAGPVGLVAALNTRAKVAVCIVSGVQAVCRWPVIVRSPIVLGMLLLGLCACQSTHQSTQSDSKPGAIESRVGAGAATIPDSAQTSDRKSGGYDNYTRPRKRRTDSQWAGMEALLSAARARSRSSRLGASLLGAREFSQRAVPVNPDVTDPLSASAPADPGEPEYSIDAIDLPLDALLYSLAEQAGLELRLQGEFGQTVTVRFVDLSFTAALEALAEQQHFRWTLSPAQLTVYPDEPYLQTYPVDYLNLSRTVKSSLGLATQVGSMTFDPDASGASSFANSSQSLIRNESHHAFWETLSAGLTALFGPEAVPAPQFSINRDAALVTVRAKQGQHQEIKNYLAQISESVSRQVLIEATVVEINLFDRFEAGIDWRLFGRGGAGLQGAQVFHGGAQPHAGNLDNLPTPSALLGAIHQSNTLGRLAVTLNLLGQFGEVKILSRPQIIAINNQSAVLKVVDNRVYFTMSVERSTTEGEEDLRTSTEIHTVPVGLVMSVTPYISADDTVVLNVRPTISRILGFVNDPNPELAAAQVQSGVPEIQVREMESVLSVASGQIAMIGGLMQEQSQQTDTRLPLLGKLPVIGSLFSDQKKNSGTTELMVFLQPTVLDRSASFKQAPVADIDLPPTAPRELLRFGTSPTESMSTPSETPLGDQAETPLPDPS
ncbi:MAG: hypothetical protein KTR33_04175 [Gammaproteobacteria bacterium]|nr:hypothetical protein [Gammaproteobacteria bacterium]